MPPVPRSPSSLRTVAVLAAQLEDAYQTGIWRGIVARAAERGLGVTCFVGPGEGAPGITTTRGSIAYQIASPQAFGGLIRLSNTLGVLPDPPDLAGLPQVSLGWKLPGIPSVTVDGAPGLQHLVRHLVRDHGRSRFAMVTGPLNHGESQEREAVIRQTLADEGVGFDEDLLVRGTFYNASGADAVHQFLAAGKSFDVLMALNDRMAIGALHTLAVAGLKVPDDVAVTGFDNIEQCCHVTPTLTTVDQPLETMGALAVDMVCELLDGRIPQDRILPCEPVLRWSCGCPPRGRDMVPEGPTRLWDKVTVSRLTELLVRDDEPAFLSALAEALDPRTGGQADGWILVGLAEDGAFPGDRNRHPLADIGRRLASDAQIRVQASRLHDAEDQSTAVRNLSARIAGSFGRKSLFEKLRQGWESVGIRRGFLVLFDSPATEDAVPPVSKVVLPPDGKSFPTRDLLSARWNRPWDRGRWVVEPLVYQDEPMGYLLLEETASNLSVYGALRDQVASALKGTLLMEALRDHERSLEKEVRRRTSDLTQTNKELRNEVRRRRVLEKQVQEISDKTMRRIGQDLHDDLCQYLAGVAMLASVVRRKLPEPAGDAGPALDRIGVLLQDSVLRARHIAQGLYPPGLEERGLADALEELLAGMRATTPATLLFETEGDCRGSSPDRRLQMFRIVQEATANAIRHSGTDVVRVLLVRDRDGGLTATVTDFGTGMVARGSRKGLGLDIMRYRADAAGLELQFEALGPGLRVVCRWPPEDNHG